MFQGADVDGLDHIAKECNDGAEVAGEVCTALEAICAAAWIFGPFGAAFIAYLKSVVIPWLKAVAAALKAFAAVLSLASGNQKQTSAGGDMSLGTGGYTTPALPSSSTADFPTLGPVTATGTAGGLTTPSGFTGGTGAGVPTGGLFGDGLTGGGLLGGGGLAGLAGGGALAGGMLAGGSLFGNSLATGTPGPGGETTAGTAGEAGVTPDGKGVPHTLAKEYGFGTVNPETLKADHEGGNALGEAFGKPAGTTTYGSTSSPGGGIGGTVSHGPLADPAATHALAAQVPVWSTQGDASLLSGTAETPDGKAALTGKLLYAQGNASGSLSLGGVAGIGGMAAAGGALGLGSLAGKATQEYGAVELEEKGELSAGASAATSGAVGVMTRGGKVFAGADLTAQAFAGVQAKQEGSVTFGHILTFREEGAAQFGVGAAAGASAAYENGHLVGGLRAGFALGPGLTFAPSVDVNVDEAARQAELLWRQWGGR